MYHHVMFVYMTMYFIMACALMYLGYSCLYKNMQNESSSSYKSLLKEECDFRVMTVLWTQEPVIS